MNDTKPTLGPIKRTNGIAAQVAYTVTVSYPGEESSTVTFVGVPMGGPIVMITESGAQSFVSDPSRFGEFGPEWVRRFFA